jgi:hypothetical protein
MRSGIDEIETFFVDPLAGLGEHENLAVAARVQVRAAAALRVDYDLLSVADDVQLEAELLGDARRIVVFRPGMVLLADRMGVPRDAETGEEIDPLGMLALILDDLGGEQRIESAADQRQCFGLLVHQIP